MATQREHGIIPYQKDERDIYSGLEFNPDAPEPLPDAMYQEPILREIMYLLEDRLITVPGRRDVFLSSNTFICYNRSNLNVRIGPDCYVAFGVDAAAIRGQRLYLPWAAGKFPDFALEVASESTYENDIGDKRRIYETLGIGEYWRFDATGGDLYGEPLIGERLADGAYQRIELTREADGSIRGYSPVLDLILSWEPQPDGEGWLCFYDPATGQRLPSYSTVVASRYAAEERAEAAETQAAADRERAEADRERAEADRERAAAAEEQIAAAEEQAAADRERAASSEEQIAAAEEEIRELREQLRRLREQ